MAGRLQIDIQRMEAHNLEFPAFWLGLQNARCIGGRALNVRHPASFEDIIALHRTTGEIIRRETDHTTLLADKPGSVPCDPVKTESEE